MEGRMKTLKEFLLEASSDDDRSAKWHEIARDYCNDKARDLRRMGMMGSAKYYEKAGKMHDKAAQPHTSNNFRHRMRLHASTADFWHRYDYPGDEKNANSPQNFYFENPDHHG